MYFTKFIPINCKLLDFDSNSDETKDRHHWLNTRTVQIDPEFWQIQTQYGNVNKILDNKSSIPNREIKLEEMHIKNNYKHM